MTQMGFISATSVIDKTVIFESLWNEMSHPKDANQDRKVSMKTLKNYMCVIQSFELPSASEPKNDGLEGLTPKQKDHIRQSTIRLHQNRKDFVMRTKNEYYATLKAQKNIFEPVPTFAPQINKPKN